MTASSLIMERQACFHFKTSFTPCTILQLVRYDLDELEQHIGNAIAKAPHFFQDSPIIIDLTKIPDQSGVNFEKIKQILIANGMAPVGVRGGNDEQQIKARASGLPILTIGKISHSETPSKKAAENEYTTKFIKTPIRSGMQVYARKGDLIVMAPVSSGAELLADGHIHVYGPLRGRALAGVQGNANARIFCRTLEAELVSIAGYYLTKEEMQNVPNTHGMIQIYLDQEQVRIEIIS
jgi:septum site-determining protein MinC